MGRGPWGDGNTMPQQKRARRRFTHRYEKAGGAGDPVVATDFDMRHTVGKPATRVREKTAGGIRLDILNSAYKEVRVRFLTSS